MRKWLVPLSALGMLATAPLHASSFVSVTASSGVSTTAHATSTGFGLATVMSFGTAGSSIVVAPGFSSATSSQSNSVRGQSSGKASYGGTANTSAFANGFGAWSAPH